MLPRLTQATAPLTREIDAVDEDGEAQRISIPAERDLTIYVDRRELVTLMTLGAHPEWLVLGYLRNQRLVESAGAVEAGTRDWDGGAAAGRPRAGIGHIGGSAASRTVTTGRGPGSGF